MTAWVVKHSSPPRQSFVRIQLFNYQINQSIEINFGCIFCFSLRDLFVCCFNYCFFLRLCAVGCLRGAA